MSAPAWRAIQSIPLYPVALAAAFVMSRYLETTDAIQAVPRPLLIVVAVALVIQLGMALLTRSRVTGSYYGAVILMIIIQPLVGLLLVVAGVLPLVLAARARRRIEGGDWQRLNGVLNVIAVLLLVINTGTVLATGADATLPSAQPSTGSAAADAPDIYLIMLDGYPRGDTLRDTYGFDNEPFLQSMEAMGFEVARSSHSNYNATILSLATMLEMAPVAPIAGGTGTPRRDERALVRSINHAQGTNRLRELGYTIMTVPSGISGVSLYTADAFHDSGQVTSFEILVARSGLLPLLLPDAQRTWFHDQARTRLGASFDRLAELAGNPSATPRFIFTHLMSPHPPVVFGADGSPREGTICFPTACDLFADLFNLDVSEALRGQVTYTNRLVRQTVEAILRESARPPVIVIFSDHGRRHDLEDLDETIRSMLMAYTPGHSGVFPDDASPINILPRILNAYAGTTIPLAPEDAWVLDLDRVGKTGYFDLARWTPSRAVSGP